MATRQDNEHWRRQREVLTEAFLPMGSLSKIFPVSAKRATNCAERLARLSRGSGAGAGAVAVDMNEFYLHEAQAQLQLALFGNDEAWMESTNKKLRDSFGGKAALEYVDEWIAQQYERSRLMVQQGKQH